MWKKKKTLLLFAVIANLPSSFLADTYFIDLFSSWKYQDKYTQRFTYRDPVAP